MTHTVLAIPKSAIFTFSAWSMSMFEVLISRCIKFLEWQAAMADNKHLITFFINLLSIGSVDSSLSMYSFKSYFMNSKIK